MTTAFTPIFCARSDGKTEIVTKGVKQKNGPSAAQLDRTPNGNGVSDYYRELDSSEPKHQDWRKKLGGMLLRELGGPELAEKSTTSILYELPENYRLFEHIKSKAEGDKTATKNHSGGGHDRQDAYLYGHPRGPKKRFRSPADFFPHLLWLATDEAGDPENCTCKLCCPEQVEIERPGVKEEFKAMTPTLQIKNETPNASPKISGRVTGTHPIVQIPVHQQSASATPTQSPRPTPLTVPAAANGNTVTRPRSVPAPIDATPLPQPRSLDQQVDREYQKFVCRPGEVVWFRRGVAWGLGAVMRRWIARDPSNTRSYMVQPLSHPLEQQPVVTVSSDDVRPWLAWSPPPPTYQDLQDRAIVYDLVDWHRLITSNVMVNAEVDASIVAARTIDTTYTPFDFLKSNGPDERHWNGVFLGAEKIWNGEPVRLRIGSNNEVMIITNIIERGFGGPTPTITVIGDVYSQSNVDVPNPSSPPELPSHRALPLRMQEDMRWRNSITLPATRTLSFWRLMAAQTRLDIGQVKGRWYETSILFPTQFREAVTLGKPGNTSWMNSRGDAAAMQHVAGVRKDSRLAAFGAAVPPGSQIVDGIEAPHQQQGHDGVQGMQDLTLESDGGVGEQFAPDLSEFMNLEGTWDADGTEGGFGFGGVIGE